MQISFNWFKREVFFRTLIGLSNYTTRTMPVADSDNLVMQTFLFSTVRSCKPVFSYRTTKEVIPSISELKLLCHLIILA